jgi:hypothetical protein
MIERRPKILRFGDKSDPFMFAVDYRSRNYRKRISVSQTFYCCYYTSECYSTAEETTRTCGYPDFAGSDDFGRVVGKREVEKRPSLSSEYAVAREPSDCSLAKTNSIMPYRPSSLTGTV